MKAKYFVGDDEKLNLEMNGVFVHYANTVIMLAGNRLPIVFKKMRNFQLSLVI